MRVGYIYFLLDLKGRRLKIGFSTRLEKRIKALKFSSGRKLSLIGTIPGTMDLENDLHARFFRYRLVGEWYQYTKALQCEIDCLLSNVNTELVKTHFDIKPILNRTFNALSFSQAWDDYKFYTRKRLMNPASFYY